MALAKRSEGTAKEHVDYKVQVTRATQFESGAVGFDMTVNGVKIYNCTAKTVKSKKTGEDVDLINFPEYKSKNGEYYSYAWFPISLDLKESIINQINGILENKTNSNK